MESNLFFIAGEEAELSGQFVEYLLLALAGIGVEVFFFLLFLLRLWWLRETERLQFGDAVHLPGGQSLALGLKALDADELFDVYLFCSAELVVATIGDQQTRVAGVSEQYLLGIGILA